ncbi:MAG TPA: hypothetical protein VD905_03200, partial [Flavobacteriales bacterium]|nr:hypothetical protein [Flavobacteriales bacterium]
VAHKPTYQLWSSQQWKYTGKRLALFICGQVFIRRDGERFCSCLDLDSEKYLPKFQCFYTRRIMDNIVWSTTTKKL